MHSENAEALWYCVMAGINLRKLERELSNALEADKRYARENDAKFRAVNQKVASYEEFR